MRAVIFREHSPSLDVYEVVDDMPTPEIGPDDVLIKVHFAALNRLDDFVRRGWRGLDLEMPHIPGSDFAGEIAAVGDHVRGWEIGQRVTGNPTLFCGQCRYCQRGDQHLCERFSIVGEHVRGAYAEYMRLPARNLIAAPDGFDLKLAAAGNLVFLTAWRNLIVDGGLRPGETVLVVGAGGGVNMASIQLAKLAGATVWVIASNAEKAEKALALGADWALDRSQEPHWGKAVWKKSNRQGVDVVVDNVGAATWSNSLRSLGRQGRLLTVGGTSGYKADVPVNIVFIRQLRIIGSTMGSMEDARQVFGLIFAGKVTPVIDSIYPLDDYVKAIQRLQAGEHFGKIVIDVTNV
ncbi:MAG TPA: zinc-binding dehydrogenase [Caldilineae bacterium]|nr:zinc-binding dehydrogenase [Caldilineae bacterium]